MGLGKTMSKSSLSLADVGVVGACDENGSWLSRMFDGREFCRLDNKERRIGDGSGGVHLYLLFVPSRRTPRHYREVREMKYKYHPIPLSRICTLIFTPISEMPSRRS